MSHNINQSGQNYVGIMVPESGQHYVGIMVPESGQNYVGIMVPESGQNYVGINRKICIPVNMTPTTSKYYF